MGILYNLILPFVGGFIGGLGIVLTTVFLGKKYDKITDEKFHTRLLDMPLKPLPNVCRRKGVICTVAAYAMMKSNGVPDKAAVDEALSTLNSETPPLTDNRLYAELGLKFTLATLWRRHIPANCVLWITAPGHSHVAARINGILYDWMSAEKYRDEGWRIEGWFSRRDGV